jgi:YggT family protein
MLIRILAFTLETIFFFLIAAALLRAWMNWVRVNMRGQPGSFVMALTDWLVKPLRRTLPKALGQAHIDWASLLAAVVLAVLYALVWMLLFGVLMAAPGVAAGFAPFAPFAVLGLLIFAVKMLIRVALQTLFILVLGFAILSWVQPGSAAYALLGRLTEPLLAPLRRVIPTIGGVDLSALVLLLLLQIGLMVLV